MSHMRFRVLPSFALTLLTPALAAAQGTSPAPAPPQITLPPVTVTAQKEPADPQTLPVSLTAVPVDSIWNGGLLTPGDFSIYAPNTYFSDFTARKLSNARFRGIGSSPANPSITTFIDGVPQLNSNSSSIELLDVDQLEFVRGPQSALFGRNTLGGLVNVSSVRPSLTKWTGSATVPFGNYNSVDVRANTSGPLGSKAAVGFAIGHSQRDGFTTNDVTGHDVDSRDATFGKAQFLFVPGHNWETRFIYTGERARDGDYALNDLGTDQVPGLRQRPFHTSRDFEGHTDRDINASTVLARYAGQTYSFTSTTGFVKWKTFDETDLDYSPLPLLTRSNDEQDFQFTQEVRLASGPAGAVKMGANTSMRWQGGLFLFSQNYDQLAINTFAPFVLSPFIDTQAFQVNPKAALDDTGFGVFGQATFATRRLDLTVGARGDHESRDAELFSYVYGPAIDPLIQPVSVEKSFSNVSPQFSVAFRARQDTMAYFSVTNGFKAGGFNPASPQGSESFGEEHSWNYEGGVKSTFAGRRATANVSVFSIDWQDLQLNVPNSQVPGQFYISNVGDARSSGVEAEVHGRARDGVDLFGAFGYTHARFGDGTSAGGVVVGGNEIPNTPSYTFLLGTELSHPVHGLRVYGRAEAVFYGAYQYDEANTAGQDAYSLTNFRAGARGKLVFAEFWMRNAFNTEYIPVAFPYPGLTASGFVGESGRPRTFGVTAGVSF
jgi:iron complex outermembrane receptor protein